MLKEILQSMFNTIKSILFWLQTCFGSPRYTTCFSLWERVFQFLYNVDYQRIWQVGQAQQTEKKIVFFQKQQ